jgi:hypothetical protein
MSGAPSEGCDAVDVFFKSLQGKRVLVAGSYPPPFNDLSRSTLSIASRALREGAIVEVLSPSLRSAAHLRQRLDSWRGCVALWKLASKHEVLLLHLEERLPLGAKERLPHFLESFLLAIALRRWNDVLIQLDSPDAMPGGLGGRSGRMIWNSARMVVVLDANIRATLIGSVKLPDEKVHLLPVRTRYERYVSDEDLSVRDQESAIALIKARAELEREISARFHLE